MLYDSHDIASKGPDQQNCHSTSVEPSSFMNTSQYKICNYSYMQMEGYTVTYMMCKRVPYNYSEGVKTEHDADNGNKSVKVKIHVLQL